MSQQARAVLFHGPGKPLEIRDAELPVLSHGETLVRIRCTTLCGSDIHTFTGKRSTPLPTVLGHEILGTLEAVPDGIEFRDFRGELVRPGDRVTWSVAASCGSCFFCDRGLPQKCESLFKYGHSKVDAQNTFNGGLADYCHLMPGTPVFLVPERLPDEVACPVNCATATVAAAVHCVDSLQGACIAISGAGMLGLTCAAMAKSLGAKAVIVTDINPNRLDLARRFGATTVLLASNQENVKEAIQTTTSGRGVDVLFEMSGARAAVASSVDLVRIGGTCVWVGSVFPDEPIPLLAETVARKILSIHGVHNYRPDDLGFGLDFLARHHNDFPFESLVATRFPLEKTQEALEYAAGSEEVRVLVYTYTVSRDRQRPQRST